MGRLFRTAQRRSIGLSSTESATVATMSALAYHCLPAAQRNENRIRVNFPLLRALTAVERENMALVYYGPSGSSDLNRQYYIPSANGSNWDVNYTNNRAGVDYANYFRTNSR